MRDNIFDGFNWNHDLVVPFLTGCKEYFQSKGFIGIKFFLGWLETQFLLIFFRHVDSIRYFSFGKIFNDKGFSCADASESRGEVDFSIVFKFKFRFCTNTCQR